MAIRIARVLCIIGLVYSHGWTGLTGHELQLSLNNPQSVFRIILVELFGRSSVPLLSAISGYLVVASAGKRDYGGFVSAKARAILAPMILWNALAILLVSGSAWLFSLPAPQPIDTLWFADELLSLTRANDINEQMPFLRDLFLCMLAAPLLVHAPNRWLVLLAAITFAWTASEWSTPIFQRPPILLFFLIGMLVRRQGLAPMLAGLSPWLIWPAFVMLAGLKITVLLGHAPFTDMLTAPRVDLALRLAGALATWQLVWRLADSRWAPAFCRLEPYMFLLFASHLIFMWLAGPMIGKLTGTMGAPLYPLYLTLQPALALGTALILAVGLRRLPAPVGDLLSGGRLPR